MYYMDLGSNSMRSHENDEKAHNWMRKLARFDRIASHHYKF